MSVSKCRYEYIPVLCSSYGSIACVHAVVVVNVRVVEKWEASLQYGRHACIHARPMVAVNAREVGDHR